MMDNRLNPKHHGTVSVGVGPGARLVGSAVPHQVRSPGDRTVGLGRGRLGVLRATGADRVRNEGQQSTHGASVAALGATWGHRGPPHRRVAMTDLAGERRGLRCVVFDIRVSPTVPAGTGNGPSAQLVIPGGANVTPPRARSFAMLVATQVSASVPSHSAAGAGRDAGGAGRHSERVQLVGSAGHGLAGGHHPGGQLNRELWVGAVIASLVVGVIVWA